MGRNGTPVTPSDAVGAESGKVVGKAEGVLEAEETDAVAEEVVAKGGIGYEIQ